MSAELFPQMARPAASGWSFPVFCTSGRISITRSVAYCGEWLSYSKLRFGQLGRFGFAFGIDPESMKTTTSGGGSAEWMRLSKTIDTRYWPFG
jgi:hypothetical protein